MGMFNRPANLTDTSQASDAPQHGASDDTRFVSSQTERTSSGRVKAADAPRDSRSSELAPVSSLIVAVRTRPSVLALDPLRSSGRKDILRVMDARTVVVLDPDDSKLYLDKRVGRTKERRYTFDYAFGPENGNRQVYDKTAKLLIPGVLSGHNGTVFAYGATGSGKTHTMVGSAADPGMMVLSLKDVFDGVNRQSGEFKFEVTCSYLEVYNELIFDLLMPDGSPPLELRDGPGGGTAPGGGGMQSGGNQNGCVVFGLKKVKVSDRDEIMHLLNMGNARRKVEPTEANSVSSRSHAVLEINVERKALGGGDPSSPVLSGKLSLVDLAGSERASETRNFGNKLRDGANINKSLLALANCINALGKKQTNNTSSTSGDFKSAANGAANNNETSGKKVGYVPFRNSKLTRLLKESLSGNSRTCMVANVSCGADQYNHTINTLKYADRAKEIKTHVVQNLQTVETHLGEYRRLIDTLQGENSRLKETVRAMENGTAGFGKDASHRERASAATQVAKPAQSKEPPGTQPNRYREFLFRQPEQPGRSQNQGSAASNHKPATKHELDSLLNEFHENTEERLSFQKSLYEFEDEKIQTQRALTGFAHNSTKHRQLTRAVVEHEAACLRYRTEIDMADRAAGRILEKTKDVANASGDVSLYKGRPGSSSSSGSSLPFADALVDSLQRWRDSDCQREEQNFAVDLRESVIAEQRDAIDLLLTRIPKHEISEFFLETLRRLDLSDKRLAFWEHTFEPPGSNTGTPVAAAAKHITVTPPPRLAESAETQSRAGSGRRRRSSVETGNTTALTASAGEKFTHRRVTPTSALALSRESSGRSSASGSEGGLSVGSGSERASEGRGDVSRVSSGRAYSNHQRGVGGGAGGIGTVSAGVLSKRRKEKPPVSASAVHGVGSRLKALQLVRHRVDTDRDPRVAIGRSVAPMKARVSSAAPVTRAGGGSVVDLEKVRDRRVRETTRGGSARLFASPHSPSARRPEIETPEAFIIARPGR